MLSDQRIRGLLLVPTVPPDVSATPPFPAEPGEVPLAPLAPSPALGVPDPLVHAPNALASATTRSRDIAVRIEDSSEAQSCLRPARVCTKEVAHRAFSCRLPRTSNKH